MQAYEVINKYQIGRGKARINSVFPGGPMPCVTIQKSEFSSVYSYSAWYLGSSY